MSFVKTLKGYFGAKRTEDPIKKFSHLNVRTNSLLTLDETFFILNNEYTIIENPGPTHQVTDVGEFEVMGMKAYRFYVDSLNNTGESFVQVVDGSNELLLFRPIDEIYPQTQDEWSHWNGPEGILNQPIFCLSENLEYENTWRNAVHTTEHVTPDASSKDPEPYKYPVHMQLFERTVSLDNGTEFKEFILAAIEDEERVNVYAGVSINSAGANFS